MGKGYKHGGGGGANPLNFVVKAYLSETELKADKPRENTIGIIPGATMTSWEFSATEPKEPEVGMVWFSVGTASQVAFNALKKNTLEVYPIIAKQYVGGAFAEISAYSYQNSEWLDWIEYLFHYGKQRYSWSTVALPSLVSSNNEAKAPTITKNEDGSVNITLSKGSNSYSSGAYIINEEIDLTDKSKLSISVEGVASCFYFGLYVIPANADAWTSDPSGGGDAVANLQWKSPDNSGVYDEDLDVSALTGKYKICVGVCVSASLNNGGCKLKQIGWE